MILRNKYNFNLCYLYRPLGNSLTPYKVDQTEITGNYLINIYVHYKQIMIH